METAEPETTLTPEILWSIPRVGVPSASDDGRVVVVGVTTFDVEKNAGTEVLYRVDPDGTSRALTSDRSSSGQAAVSPDGRWLAFVRKAGARNKPQLHLLPLDGGEAHVRTDLPLGARHPRWFPDSRRVLVLSDVLRDTPTVEATEAAVAAREASPVQAHVTEERTYRFWDRWLTPRTVPHAFVVDVAGGGPADLTPTSRVDLDLMDDSTAVAISPEGAHLAWACEWEDPETGERPRVVQTIEVATGAVRTWTSRDVACERPLFSPDGRALAWLERADTTHYADRARLVLCDLASGRRRVVTEAWDRSVGSYAFVSTSRAVLEVEDRGRVALFDCDLRVGATLPVRITGDGCFAGVRVVQRQDPVTVLARHDGLTSPAEVVSVSLADRSVHRLTHFTADALRGVALARVTEQVFAGARDEPVQMFVLIPPGFDPSKRYPLVHVIHGGPHAISGDQWHARWNAQVIAARGAVVALVNFHGSTSFGEHFSRSIQGVWGTVPGEDVLRATDALVAQYPIDPARMAISGGSYGGYLVSWLVTQTDRFACGIDHAGVFDLPDKYASDETSFVRAGLGGEPWGDDDEVARIDRENPLRHMRTARTPLLVLHGERDFRVPYTHGLLLYGILRRRGVPARLVVYPDENHWILKPQNALHWHHEFLDWLERWIGLGAVTPAATAPA